MSWFELLLFAHVALAVIWVGGGLMMQFFGIRASMSGDPARMAAFGEDIDAGVAVAVGLVYWRYRVALAQRPPPAPASSA